jgi:hypothetical protein
MCSISIHKLLPPKGRRAGSRTISKQLRHLYSPSLFSYRGNITIAVHYWSYGAWLSPLTMLLQEAAGSGSWLLPPRTYCPIFVQKYSLHA